PHCIKRTLNTFKSMTGLYPLDDSCFKLFRRIDEGSHPHFTYRSKLYNVTIDEYKEWLKVIYLLLIVKDKDGDNMLSNLVNKFYLSADYVVYAFLNTYNKDESVLLSDRSFTTVTDDEDNSYLSLEFNLDSTSFVNFIFASIDSLPCSEEMKQEYKRHLKNNGNWVTIEYSENDLDILAEYNKRVIYQSYEHVYCSKDIIF
ncbi:hypothetical protein L4C36_23825, partial [Photobacterium japonica]|uniref:hypothetical protein n=1 Tax=Photobacterium japonica TaxID=2910235 RepID=UPI003D123F9D